MTTESESFTISAGWLIDGTGNPIKRHAVMAISNGIIASVSNKRQDYTGDENEVDFSNYMILPGLMDSHVHLTMSGDVEQEIREKQLKAGYPDVRSVISRHLNDQLENGIVVVRDGGDRAGHSFKYKNEGSEEEPPKVDFRVAGKAWHSSGRYGKLIGRSPGTGQDLGQAIMEGSKGIDHVKIVNSGLNSLTRFAQETPPQFSREQLKKAVTAAKNMGLKVMVHANGGKAVRDAIDAGCHSIEHGYFMGRENLSLLAEKGTVWVPTAYTMKAYSDIFSNETRESDIAKRNFEHQIEQISIALEYGVKISVGTDSGSPGVHHGRAVRKEVEILVSAGYSIEIAIQCVTLNSAELLGLDSHSGSLVPGKDATFIAVPCRPDDLSESMGNIEALYIKGRRINARI